MTSGAATQTLLSLLWDQANPYSYALVAALNAEPPSGMVIATSGLDPAPGNLLNDVVIPAVLDA
ncbi:MAG: hypothetical protein ACRD12_03750, partial [Acidimicrobiales bacterium]